MFVARTEVRATLTTGTFNLLSKTESLVRLSGANSVRLDPLRESVRPRNLLTVSFRGKAVNRLKSQDFHLISTMRELFAVALQPSRGEQFTARNETSLPRGVAKIIRRKPTRKHRVIKDRRRFCYSRKPFRDLVPECEPRKRG